MVSIVSLQRFSCFVVLSAAGASAQTVPSTTIFAQLAPTYSFGMLGLASGQSARLNVVNLVRTPPPIEIAQAPCKVDLNFYDNQGKLIKQKTVENLGYGQADFLDLDRSEISGSQRVEVTGAAVGGSTQLFFCLIMPTLEIIDDATGRTTAILTSSTSPVFPFISPRPLIP